MSWIDDFNKLMGVNTTQQKQKQLASNSWLQEYNRIALEEEERKKREAAQRKKEESSIETKTTVTPSKKDKEDESLLDFFQIGGLDDIDLGSRFEDGWQFGDGLKTAGDTLLGVGKTILGTAGDAGLEVVKGAGSMLEGIVDAASYGMAGVSDLIGQKEYAEKVRSGAKVNLVEDLTRGADNYLEQYSVLGRTSDAIAQGIGQVGSLILTGGLGQAAGFGSAGVTALTTGSMGLSGMGSGMSQAYKEGATDEEALTYGAIAGTADALSELIFGGLGKAVKATGLSTGLFSADDMLAKKVSNLFTSQIAKNFAEFGIKAGAEGFEEILAGTAQAIGKKITYMSEEDLWDIVKDENLLEQFVVGAATSGVIQSGLVPGMSEGSLKEANREGKDFITGFTQNEQAVIAKEVEKRVAQQEKNGKKLTKNEKAAIEVQVEKDLDKGYISIDTIEEAVGGEAFQNYKTVVEKEDAFKQEFETLNKMKQGEMTGEQIDRRTELKEKLEWLKKNSQRGQLKTRLREEAFKIAQSDRLIESYNERERRKQYFEADLTKYTNPKAKQSVQNLMDAKVANNTNRTREMADTVAKLAEDKDIVFHFTSNQKLKEEGNAYKSMKEFTADGNTAVFELGTTKIDTDFQPIVKVGGESVQNFKVDFDKGTITFENAPAEGQISVEFRKTGMVNGFNDGKGNITINMDSPRYWNFIVGHEVTHSLEKAKAYEDLQKAVFAYAQTKGEYQGRYDSLKSRYNEGTNIEQELTADLVGDYIFNDQAFVNDLSTNHQNIFQKIFSEIKYLLKVVTAGSKEARQLEKAKRMFEKAYRESNKAGSDADADVQYSVVSDKETLDFLNNQELVKVYRAMQEIDGELYPPMAAKIKDDSGKKKLVESTKPNTWYQSDEHPELIKFEVKEGKKNRYLTAEETAKNADVLYGNPSPDDLITLRDGSTVKFGDLKYKFELDKANGASVPAAYNPYFHTSLTALNDQFSSAYDRPNLVVVEGYIPKSELDSGYQALYAKNPVGEATWHAGPVASQLKGDKARRVFLSRWFKADRVVPNAEAAKRIAETLEGEDISVPWNVVTPSLRAALEAEGVKIDYKDIKAGSKTVSFASTQPKYSISETTDGRYVAVVDSDILSKIDTSSWDDTKKAEAKKAASEALKKFGDGIAVDGITRKVNRTSRREYTRSNDTERLFKHAPDVFADKMRAAEIADDIVVATTNWQRDGGLKHPRTDDFVDFDHGMTLIQSGNAKYSAEVVVGITAAGDAVFYDVVDMTPAAFDIKKEESPTTATTQNAIGDIQGDSFVDNVAQNGNGVKHSLSAEQEEYFKDSVVRDENGNLKVMYHGTSKGGFHMFDTYGSNYGLFGTGSYFTDNKDVAQSYTNKGRGNNKQVYETYLNIKNPMDMDAQADPAQWQKAFPDADFPESGTNEQFYRAVEEFYADQWMSKWEAAEEIQAGIESGMGYDGLTHIGGGRVNADSTRHRVYIAFQPEQIKNVDNAKPTDSADIRYSLSEDGTQLNKITDSGLTMTYVRIPNQNTQYYGSTYGQNLEPAGEYMSMDTMQGKYKIDGYEYGTIQFKKPLVLEHINTSDTGWKKTVSDMYNGLTGRKLTNALIKDGYDAIVTYDDYGYSEIVNLNGKKLNDPGAKVSLSDASEQYPYTGNFGAPARDLRVATQEDIAPVREYEMDVSKMENSTVSETEMVEDLFPDGVAPEVELENLYQQAEALGYRMREAFNADDTDALEQASTEYADAMERIETLEREINQNESSRMDSIAQSEEPPEMDAPFYGEPDAPVMPDDPFEDRDYSDVGKRNVKAYMYENPEVKPFFQMEANAMLGDLGNSIRGERLFNDQVYYDSGGEKGWMGTKRMTTDDIAYLLDSGYTYAEIEKGLNAIIEDNGAENNAVSKRIEFAINDRLLKGYTNIYGDQIPPDQDYINLLREKEITAYSQEAFDAFMANADQYAPAEDIAPVAVQPARATAEKTTAVQDIAPTYDVTGKKGVPDGQQAFMPDAGVEPKLTRKQLHQNIVDRVKASFQTKGFDFDDVLKNAKDLATIRTVDNTPQRVMEKALGYKQGQVLSDLTLNQVAKNETEGIKWLNAFTDRKKGLLAQISKEYNIKPGSKKSAAAQMYAEGFYVGENKEIIAYGDRELAMDFPNVKVQQQIKGLARDPRIRQIYDETLAAINESRTRNAYPEIPRLDNYFLHFREMEDAFSKWGLPFNPNDIRSKDLPTDLNGMTADLKPGQPYFASAMHRTGKRTSFDLLGGLEKYLTSAKNQIYHIDDIQTLRAVRNYIADMYGQAKGLENLDEMSDAEAEQRIQEVYDAHLSTFAKFLNEEANVLAGKTALIDRGAEGIFGRRAINFLNTLNRQVGSNMVGYNISSSLTNFLAPVQAFAKSNKFDFVKGMAQTAANKVGSIFGHGDGFAEASPVMIRRKGADAFYRTPWQKLTDPGYVLMGAVDEISTELIARAKYNELTRKGMDSQQAHYETDKWVSRLMGDRSLGQQPQLYNSKALGLFTKFQLEVRNQLDSQFYDTIQEAKVSTEDIQNGLLRNAKKAAKITSVFVQLAGLQYVFGKVFESVAGYNPAFDIISTIIKAFGWDDDEEDEDTVLDNIEEGFFELMGDMPYVSTLTGGRIPIESALPIEELYKGEDKYGNEKSRWKTLGEAAPYYLLPGGYGQIKKTMQGLDMFEEDLPIAGSYTDSGNLRFPVEDTTQNRVQAALFGQWASENARDYFDNEWKPLNEKQTQEFIDSDMPIRDYREYREGLSDLSKLAEKADYIDSLDLPISTKNLLINNIADRKDPIDMTNYDEFGSFEEFDYAQKNPEKYDFLTEYGISYSQYKSFGDDAKEEIDNAYSWVKNNPEKVTFSKAVTDNVLEYRQYTSALNAIRADKDSSGKSISGSAKAKKVEYINSLDLDYGAKLVLFKNEYNADDTYNGEIIEYIISRDDFSYEDKVAILKELGFEVSSDGTVTW